MIKRQFVEKKLSQILLQEMTDTEFDIKYFKTVYFFCWDFKFNDWMDTNRFHLDTYLSCGRKGGL